MMDTVALARMRACVCVRESGRAVSGRLIKDGGGGEVVVLGGMRFKQPSFD